MRLSAPVFCLLTLAGCSPIYAPPIRGLHAGMPGRVSAGQLELGATWGGVTVPTMGGPHVSYGLSDALLIEGGVNLNVLEQPVAPWATGWAGVRATRRLSTGRGIQLIADAELGTGAGLGGRSREASDWTDLVAYGIYEGFGLGAQWKWLGIYVRGRLDAAASTSAPTTLWPTAMAGLELRPSRRFSFGVGGGYAGYWNTSDRLMNGWFYQAQLAIDFDLFGATAL